MKRRNSNNNNKRKRIKKEPENFQSNKFLEFETHYCLYKGWVD
jgi:hypothetical protein